jgi:phage recombination protein Bet
MEKTQALVKLEEKPMEYVPFGSQDKIKLTVSMVKNQLAVKTRTGKTCTDQDAIKFLMMCSARRLNPWEGDAFLIGYDGKDGPSFSLITAHQAFLKRAELNAEYDGMKSGVIVEQEGEMKDLEGDFYVEGSQKVVGGWATVYFKNRKQPMHKRVRLKRFQKSWGIWQDDSAGMICKCAEADALRSSFPTMLGGLYLKEEVQREPDVKASAPLFMEPSKPATESEPIDVKGEYIPEPEGKPEGRESFPSPHDTTVQKHPQEDSGSGEYNTLKAVKGFFKLAGIKEEQVIHFLKELGSIDPEVKTLDEVAEKAPDVLTLVHDQHAEVINKIKAVK